MSNYIITKKGCIIQKKDYEEKLNSGDEHSHELLTKMRSFW
jgi:hypothetical protein